MAEQKILSADNDYKELDEYLRAGGHKRILLVCGSSIMYLKLDVYFQTLERRTGIKVVRFSGFNPNPLYESVVEGVKLFHSADCSIIIAVGGGSAIDTAKCIKLYSNMDDRKNYLEQKIIPNETELIAIPTTHAAVLCVRKLWPYMIENIDNCTDPRGRKYLQNIFREMAETMGYPTSIEAARKFHAVYDKLGLSIPAYEETDINILKASVNPVRLKNNPVALTENDIEILYRQILRKEEKQL